MRYTRARHGYGRTRSASRTPRQSGATPERDSSERSAAAARRAPCKLPLRTYFLRRGRRYAIAGHNGCCQLGRLDLDHGSGLREVQYVAGALCDQRPLFLGERRKQVKHERIGIAAQFCDNKRHPVCHQAGNEMHVAGQAIELGPNVLSILMRHGRRFRIDLVEARRAGVGSETTDSSAE